ncbi:Scr1 family TA system antitoxin-like transcriptional regulator [Nocardia sp. 2YAB30]|uniref:Scr1 family TA system antitoxin-like transcriptional regulator n=1 Tax=unclassified Nocardia TaxID=2637762 RepID=UPI003F961B7B
MRDQRRNPLIGLLQTAEYAEAIIRQAIDFYRIPNDLDLGVAKRLERQQVLYKGDHRFHILVGEHALLTDVARDGVMIGQLDRLLAAMGLPRMAFGIVPLNAYCPAPSTNFAIYDDRRVLVEAVSAELTITQPREIATYQRTFHALTREAVVGDAARALIAAALERRS